MAYPSTDKDDRDLHILATKRLIGTARTDISCLDFIGGRQIDDRIVENLVGVFKKTRCQRYNPDHFIPVLIFQANLEKALKASGLSQTALGTPARDGSLPFLRTNPKQKLSCVHGKHRVKAASYFLPSDDRWWTVKVFLAKSNGN